MKKYKNLSGKDAGFIVDGRTLDFQNGQVVEGPDNFKENMQKVLDGIVPLEAARVVIPVVETKEKKATKKTTKKVTTK